MGQQSSKAHAPLTFGYISHNQQSHEELDGETPLIFEQYLGNRDRSSPDFVLDNPHLYRLESSCQHCSQQSSVPVIVAEQAPCRHCRRNKRLSLVRRDLASDLNYIDKTYYPNIVHYEEDDDDNGLEPPSVSTDHIDKNTTMDEDDDTDTLRDEEGWSKLTLGEVTPSIPKRLVSSPSLVVDLSSKSLIKLSSSIGYLSNLTKLDLSDNQMINLPRAIGQLKNLRIFNASKNQLETIPDTITSLKKLKAINLSQNRLTSLPKGLGKLPSLIILILNNNQLTELPREIANLNDLITLNVSNNPLKSIPVEISALKSLRKLIAEDCSFKTEFVHELAHNPHSLFEICARNMVKNKINLPSSLAHPHIVEYFKREQTCSFCFGPYFDSYVTRGRFIDRTGRDDIALDYKLCCAHWTDEEDRISAMFSTPYYRQQPSLKDAEIPSVPTSPVTEDYFNTMSGGQNPSPSSSAHTLLAGYSSEDMLLNTLVSPIDDNVHDMPSSSSSLMVPSPSYPSSSSSSLLLPPQHQKRQHTFSPLRPRSSSTSSSSTSSPSILRINAMQHHHQQNASSTLREPPQVPVLRPENLPFASLSGRQSEEADRILARNDTNGDESMERSENPRTTATAATTTINSNSNNKKTNGIKQGFAQLGARLGRRRGNSNASNNAGRDRSDTF